MAAGGIFAGNAVFWHPEKLIRIEFLTNEDSSLNHQIDVGEDLYREMEVPAKSLIWEGSPPLTKQPIGLR